MKWFSFVLAVVLFASALGLASAVSCPDSSYSYGQALNITNRNATFAQDVNTTYNVTFNHALLVSLSKALASGNDLAVYCGGASRYWNNITEFNTAATVIEFSLPTTIAGGASNTSCILCSGKPSAGIPANNLNYVYYFWDKFEGGFGNWSAGSVMTRGVGYSGYGASCAIAGYMNKTLSLTNARYRFLLKMSLATASSWGEPLTQSVVTPLTRSYLAGYNVAGIGKYSYFDGGAITQYSNPDFTNLTWYQIDYWFDYNNSNNYYMYKATPYTPSSYAALTTGRSMAATYLYQNFSSYCETPDLTYNMTLDDVFVMKYRYPGYTLAAPVFDGLPELVSCSVAGSIPALNFSFYDESLNSSLNVSANLTITVANATTGVAINVSTWVFYNQRHVTFCRMPGAPNVSILTSETIYNTSYYTRTLTNVNKTVTNGSVTTLNRYLLSSTTGYPIYVRFHVQTAANVPIIGASISIYKLIGSYVLMTNGVTDSSGIAAFYLSSTTSYLINASYAGYTPSTTVITPVTNDYTITLGGTSIPSTESCYSNMSFNFVPNRASLLLDDYYLNFTIIALDNAMQWYGWNVTWSNQTTPPYVQINFSNFTSPSGGTLNLTVHIATEAANGSGFINVWTFWNRNGYICSQSHIYTIYNMTGVGGGLFGFMQGFQHDSGASNILLALIAMIVITLMVVFASQYSSVGGAIIGAVMSWFFVFIGNWLHWYMALLLTIVAVSWTYYHYNRGM